MIASMRGVHQGAEERRLLARRQPLGDLRCEAQRMLIDLGGNREVVFDGTRRGIARITHR